MAVGVPRGYSSRQEYAKEVLGMDIGGVMQQPSANYSRQQELR